MQSAADIRNDAKDKAKKADDIPSRPKRCLAKAPDVRAHSLQVAAHFDMTFQVTWGLRALRAPIMYSGVRSTDVIHT